MSARRTYSCLAIARRHPRLFSLITALALATVATAHAETTVGLHIATLHVPARDYSDINPGLYVRTDNGLTFGVLRNSIGRLGAYAGVTIEQESGPFAITAGVIYGYQQRTVNCVHVSVPGNPTAQVCGKSHGSPGALAPMLNPSVRLPAVLGLTPRVTLIPPWFGANAMALHFSVERAF